MSSSSTTDLQQRLFAAPTGMDAMYRNTALDMLASSVLQQVHNEEQIHVIKGESGLGKTTFCRRLLYEAPQELSISFITATRKTGITEILASIATRDETAGSAPLQLLAKNAAQKIYQQIYNNSRPVVLIDAAHCLSTQTLANLFRFQHAIAQQNSGGFKLILVGERKIDSRLEGVDKKIIERDRFISGLLRPLTRNEIGDYIDFKFARAQGEKPRLNKKQLQYVRSHGGGIPGKIEDLCLRALQGSTFDKKRTLVAFFAAAALIAGGVAYYYHDIAGPIRPPARTRSVPSAPPASVANDATPLEIPTTTPESGIADGAVDSAPVDTTTMDAAASLAWLSNQPAEHYLIQLLGGRDPEKMNNYRQSLQLPHSLTLHASERNGQDWYLLFYGPFPDYESAVEARSQLPEDLRKNQPWIRQIGSILEKQ